MSSLIPLESIGLLIPKLANYLRVVWCQTFNPRPAREKKGRRPPPEAFSNEFHYLPDQFEIFSSLVGSLACLLVTMLWTEIRLLPSPLPLERSPKGCFPRTLHFVRRGRAHIRVSLSCVATAHPQLSKDRGTLPLNVITISVPIIITAIISSTCP